MSRDFSGRRRGRGQGLTEYVLIVALIAVGAIVFVAAFGNNVRALFAKSANMLAGQPSTQKLTGITDAADKDLTTFDAAPSR
jgi:Flp pilus assembly pilin Flp